MPDTECTAGLDARAAAIVMKSVKNTVQTGRTVVCTIHQPSMEIFQVSFASHCLPSLPHVLLYNDNVAAIHGLKVVVRV